MQRVDEQGAPRCRIRLAILALSAWAAVFLVLFLPAFASAAPAALEVQKEGGGGGSVTSLPAGISCGGTCVAQFEEGEEVTLTASADSGSQLFAWEGCDTEPSANQCKVAMEGSRVVTAVFEEVEPSEYSLYVEEEGNGEGEWECLSGGEEVFCEEEFPEGTHVTIKATPYEGSKAAVFAGDCTGSTCSLVMDKDHTVKVIFNLKEFALTVNKIGGASSGKVICELEEGPEPCKAKYPWGSEVILIATAEPGYEFVKWEGCDNSSGPGTCEVEIEESRTVKVTFGQESVVSEFTLSVNKSGTGTGTVKCKVNGGSATTCAAKYTQGTSIELVQSADPGAEFAGWGGDCTGSGACSLTMNAAHGVTAIFNLKPPPKYTLTVQREGFGSVTSDPAGIDCGANCTADYPEGASVTLTAAPADGSVFKRWTGVEGGCALQSVCRTRIGDSKVVKAVFGSVDPSPQQTGMAKVVKRVALVRGGRALLDLRCAGGPCRGGVKLTARLKTGGKKSLVIGKRSFTLSSGARRTVQVRLSTLAKREVAERGKLAVEVTGGGIFRSTVKLKAAKQGR